METQVAVSALHESLFSQGEHLLPCIAAVAGSPGLRSERACHLACLPAGRPAAAPPPANPVSIVAGPVPAIGSGTWSSQLGVKTRKQHSAEQHVSAEQVLHCVVIC